MVIMEDNQFLGSSCSDELSDIVAASMASNIVGIINLYILRQCSFCYMELSMPSDIQTLKKSSRGVVSRTIS